MEPRSFSPYLVVSAAGMTANSDAIGTMKLRLERIVFEVGYASTMFASCFVSVSLKRVSLHVWFKARDRIILPLSLGV
jgi:hypothetical protein